MGSGSQSRQTSDAASVDKSNVHDSVRTSRRRGGRARTLCFADVAIATDVDVRLRANWQHGQPPGQNDQQQVSARHGGSARPAVATSAPPLRDAAAAEIDLTVLYRVALIGTDREDEHRGARALYRTVHS
jgi:hypothetical protein